VNKDIDRKSHDDEIQDRADGHDSSSPMSDSALIQKTIQKRDLDEDDEDHQAKRKNHIHWLPFRHTSTAFPRVLRIHSDMASIAAFEGMILSFHDSDWMGVTTPKMLGANREY